MSLPDYSAVLEAIKDSLTAALPNRYVQRSLKLPSQLPPEQLLAGSLCVVSEGGGGFANYRGREGQQGQINVRLVGYLMVAEGTDPVEIEVAELALLGDLLQWVATTAVPGLDVMYPGDWRQSKQMEHPYGWLVLELTVKP